MLTFLHLVLETAFHNITAVLGDVQSGRLRALAVTGPKRALAAPDIPTLDAAALRGYDIT